MGDGEAAAPAGATDSRRTDAASCGMCWVSFFFHISESLRGIDCLHLSHRT